MKNFLAFVGTIVALMYIGNFTYPTQSKAVEHTLQGAWHNAKLTFAQAAKSTFENGVTNTASSSSVATSKSPLHKVGGSTTHQEVKVNQTAQKPVAYTGGLPNLHASANGTCWIEGSDGIGKIVSPSAWNTFVSQHPEYLREETYTNGKPAYVALAPNLVYAGTTAQQKNVYYVVTRQQTSPSYPATYGYFEAQAKAMEPYGWKVKQVGNVYVLIAPGMTTTLPNGTKVSY